MVLSYKVIFLYTKCLAQRKQVVSKNYEANLTNISIGTFSSIYNLKLLMTDL